MLQTIHFLRSHTGGFGAIYKMCEAFGLTPAQTDLVLRDLSNKGYTV